MADFPSTWQRHQAKQCEGSCWYCRVAERRGVATANWIRPIPTTTKPRAQTYWPLVHLKGVGYRWRIRGYFWNYFRTRRVRGVKWMKPVTAP